MVISLSEKTRIEKIFSVFSSHGFSTDLMLMGIWLLAGITAIYLPFLNTTIIRILLALPIVMFIPGYCLIAALFPNNDDINLIERIVLSFGLSIAVVPLVGLGLNFTPWGIRLDPIVISLTIFTLVMILAAHYRRAQLPSEKRFGMQFSMIPEKFYQEFLRPRENSVDRILNVILILVALIAIITSVCVILFPQDGERYTEFFMLGENMTATGYPDSFTAGLNYPMFIGVGNHENQESNYTIETWLLRTEFDTITNSTLIVAMDPSERLQLTLSSNETKLIPYTLSVRKPGYNRLEVLLFKEKVPDFEVTGMDRINASYRDLHLWMTVIDGAESGK